MNKPKVLHMAVAIVFSAFSVLSGAQSADVTLRSRITGVQEQPRVMYILPWQTPAMAELEPDPQSQLLEGMFDPVDRDEFLRQQTVREQLTTDPQAGESLRSVTEQMQ